MLVCIHFRKGEIMNFKGLSDLIDNLPPTMSLIGGINEYSINSERHESELPPKGRKVVFLENNGTDYDLEKAKEYFSKNQVLTVDEIYVGRSSSTVEFTECPGKRFNTVMFGDIKR